MFLALRGNSRGSCRAGMIPGLKAIVVVWLAIGVLGSVARAQCMYEVAAVITGPECAPGDFAFFSAWAMDEDGNIGGSVSCQVVATAAVWTGGATAISLGHPPGTNASGALDLMGPDHAVGQATPIGLNNNAAAYWQPGGSMLLPLLSGSNGGSGEGINSQLVIVGESNNTTVGPLQAVRWIDLEVEPLGLSMGPDAQAQAVNEDGQITGWMGTAPFTGHAFIWQDGVTTDLGVIPGGTSSRGTAINNRGNVVGEGQVPDGVTTFGQPHAFFWDGETMIDLGVLPGMGRSTARDINCVDQIVGESSPDGSARRAFLWQNGEMRRLQDIVVDDLGGFNLISAPAINDKGWIVADAGVFAVLLKPIGSPPGDVDNDCTVGIDDFLKVITEWGKTSSPADTNDDGLVGILDFLQVLSDWT